MLRIKRRTLTLSGVVFSLCCAPLAWAGDFDGSRALICTPTDMFECARGVECQRTTAEEINIPHILQVDFAKKAIRGIRSGKEDSAPIQNLQSDSGRTVLQGTDGGMAWSILVDQTSGKMSMSVSASTHAGHPVGFSILGVCIPR